MKKASTIFMCILLSPLFLFLSTAHSEKDRLTDKEINLFDSYSSKSLKKFDEIKNEISKMNFEYKKSIGSFDKSSSELSQQMIDLSEKLCSLTWMIVILTIALVLLTACMAFWMYNERTEAQDRRLHEWYQKAKIGKTS